MKSMFKNFNIKNFGFTLAEVLITLGIIGVVASITIPSLIQHHKKLETISRLKKFYSMLEQAVKLSEVDNGIAEFWDISATPRLKDGKVDYETRSLDSKRTFMTYLAPYIKYTKFDEGDYKQDDEGNITGNLPTVHLPDGSSFTVYNGACVDINYDVNGNRYPNVMGKDIFKFLICNNISQRKKYFYKSESKIVGAYVQSLKNTTRESKINACTQNSKNCLDLIIFDGWEIKSDYPYKL